MRNPTKIQHPNQLKPGYIEHAYFERVHEMNGGINTFQATCVDENAYNKTYGNTIKHKMKSCINGELVAIHIVPNLYSLLTTILQKSRYCRNPTTLER